MAISKKDKQNIKLGLFVSIIVVMAQIVSLATSQMLEEYSEFFKEIAEPMGMAFVLVILMMALIMINRAEEKK